jgi:membrane-associated protease RseP (regulator of RpoE activity)
MIRFLLLALLLAGCASHSISKSENVSHACFENNKPWPVQPSHFFDGEIHLVPSFTSNEKISTTKNYMNGYAVVFIKQGSIYQTLGLRNGDTIQSIDEITFDKLADLSTFKRIKDGRFKKMKVNRCLEFENLELKP